MINSISLVKNYFFYARKYRGNNVSASAKIAHDVCFGGMVNVGNNVYVQKSFLGRNTHIHNGCILNKVTTSTNVSLYNNGTFGHVEIESYTFVAEKAVVNMTSIGRFCSVGPYLICGYGDHPVDWVSTSPTFFSTFKQCGTTFSEKNFFEERKPVVIGHDVWIGARVFIRDGVKIGNGAIVAAGATVVKNVPNYAIVGGTPAKVIRYRFPEEIIQELLAIAWWEWPEDKLRSGQRLFAQDNIQEFLRWARASK